MATPSVVMLVSGGVCIMVTGGAVLSVTSLSLFILGFGFGTGGSQLGISVLPGAPDGTSLIYMQGELRSQNFWRLDLTTLTSRPLTRLKQRDTMRTSDVTPDGSGSSSTVCATTRISC